MLILKTKADLALTPSIRKEPIYLKDNENNFVPSIKFSQSYQIRNEQISPVTDIKVEIDVPTHYAQKPIIKYNSSLIMMNNGETPKPCEKISKLLPAGKSTSLTFPTKINCLVPGTRCIHIRYVNSIQFLVEHQFFVFFSFCLVVQLFHYLIPNLMLLLLKSCSNFKEIL